MRVCLLLGLLCALSPARATPLQGAMRVHRMLQEWRVEEAERDLKAQLAARPGHPELLLVSGELRFYKGDYEGAARQMREAIRGVRLGPADLAEFRVLIDLAQSTAEVVKGFEEKLSDGGRFLFRHARGRDALLVPYAGEALERAYEALAEDFAFAGDSDAARPKEPIRVEIYSEVADLARVSTLTLREIETSGTIALCKWNRLMIVSPRALLRGYPWLDTLTHEYAHFIVSRISKNMVPIWLHEGLAKFEERRWRGPPGGGLSPAMEHLLASALARKRFITFEQMYPSMAKLPSQEDTALAFAEVYTVVEYLHQRVGFSGIGRLIREMGRGVGDQRAVAATLGVSLEEFERGWRTWLRGRKLRVRTGMLAPQLKFRKGPPAPAGRSERRGDDEDDTGEIHDPRAKNFARLGGLLRARRRLSAAAVEYEKALDVLGVPHPMIANKLGRTYLELRDPERAISAVEPARELYPDIAGPNVTLGSAWLKKGNAEKAALYLETAIRTSPFDPAIHCGLEQAYEKLGHPHLAREAHACRVLSGG